MACGAPALPGKKRLKFSVHSCAVRGWSHVPGAVVEAIHCQAVPGEGWHTKSLIGLAD